MDIRKTGQLARNRRKLEPERSAVVQQPARQSANNVHAHLGRLQRTIGNRALARLVTLQPGAVERQFSPPQRAEGRGEATTPAAELASPLPLHLRQRAIGLIDAGRQGNQPDITRVGEDLLASGQMALRALRANVMERPGFLGRPMASLRRGERVTLLDSRDAWVLVLTPNGQTGWVHGNRLFPRVINLRSGETGSGAPRGEQIIGGRG